MPRRGLGPERHLRDVADGAPARRRASARSGDAPQVLEPLHVAAAADHVLVPARARGCCRPPPRSTRARRDHLADREPVRDEALRVDLDLVLAHEAADRRDLRDAGDALERVAERPVLERSGAPRDRGAPLRSTSAYWNTQPTPVASGPSSGSTPSGSAPARRRGARARGSAPSRGRSRRRRSRTPTRSRRTTRRARSGRRAPRGAAPRSGR